MGFVVGAVFVAAGVVYLVPAAGGTTPVVRLVVSEMWAQVVAAVVGIVAVGIGLRPILSPQPPITLANVAVRWRRARTMVGIPMAVVGLVSLVAPALDGGVGGYRVESGGAAFVLFGVVSLVYSLLFLRNPETALRRRRLESGAGLAGVATVTDFEDTGIVVGDDRKTTVRLRIEAESIEPFETSVTKILPPWAVGRLRVGERVPVHLDPDRPDLFVLRWKDDVETRPLA